MSRYILFIALLCWSGPAAFALDGRSWFPVDYAASRSRFRSSCAEVAPKYDGFCRSFAISSRRFEDLGVDAAYFSKGGRRLLVMVSGTHGPETPAGAAIQEYALRTHLERLLDAGIDVLMVHALDPFGFQTGRRVDEANVNLNRNFVTDPKDYARVNEGYRRLWWAFEPTPSVGWELLEYLRTDRRLLWQLALEKGDKRPINEAMNAGQYESEAGLNYGGHGPAPQVAIVRDLMTPLLKSHDEVLFVDWHTGLGDKGTLHWIAGETSSPELTERLKPMLGRLEPFGVRATVIAESPDFYRTTGGVGAYVSSLAPPGVRIVDVLAEFGTMGSSAFAPGTLVHGVVSLFAQVRSAHRLVVENQSWFRGCRSEATCARVRRDFRELFNPSEPGWRDGVLEQADQFLSVLISDFGSSSSPRK